MGAAPSVVDASYAALTALVAAPLAGLAVLSLRMVGRSGHIGMSLSALWRSKTDSAALILYDIVGGALSVAVVLVLGITRPPALTNGFATSPALAWAVVGSLGPLVSAGILDRLPLRSLVDFFRSKRPARRS